MGLLLQAQTCLAIALGPVEQFQCWLGPEWFVLDLDFVMSLLLLCVSACVFFSCNLNGMYLTLNHSFFGEVIIKGENLLQCPICHILSPKETPYKKEPLLCSKRWLQRQIPTVPRISVGPELALAYPARLTVRWRFQRMMPPFILTFNLEHSIGNKAMLMLW